MTIYGNIPNAELAIDAAAKSSTWTKQRDNPLAIFEGDPTALAAGKGLAIEKAGQTAVITDDNDQDKVLTPDGAGGAKWSAGVSGMILVERKEIAAAVASVTFAGLDGDVDEVYKLIARINKAPAPAATFSLQPNGLATNQGISKVINGAAAVATGGLPLITTAAFATFVTFECLIHAREVVQAITMPRTFNGKVTEINTGLNTVPQMIDFGGMWDGAGNMVSLDIVGNANSIGIGSTFELFKLVQ